MINRFKGPVIKDTALDGDIADFLIGRKDITYEDMEARSKNLTFRQVAETTRSMGMTIGFPRLTIFNIYCFTLGRYQIKQAAAYIRDSFKEKRTPIFISEVSTRSRMAKAQLGSAHKRREKYWVYIQFIEDGPFPQGIEAYYCRCPAGARTSGTCGHVAALMMYLSDLNDDRCIQKDYRSFILDPMDDSNQHAGVDNDNEADSDSENVICESNVDDFLDAEYIDDFPDLI